MQMAPTSSSFIIVTFVCGNHTSLLRLTSYMELIFIQLKEILRPLQGSLKASRDPDASSQGI